MRYDINSHNTKRALADAFQQLAAKIPPGDTITISQIAVICNVHRNTFYYHFNDIRELINWTIHDDFISGINTLDTADNISIQEFVAGYLNSHEKFLNYAFNYLGIEDFLDCLKNELNSILLDFIDSYCRKEGVNPTVPFRKFAAEAFSEQILALYLLHSRHPEKYSKKMMKNILVTVFDYQIPNAIIHEKEISDRLY